MSYAEKKEDRQMRLKALFANTEKLLVGIRSELAVKADAEGEVKSEIVRDERISRRGVFRGIGLQVASADMDAVPNTTSRQTPRLLPCSSFKLSHRKPHKTVAIPRPTTEI